jgi:hypothetical protein
VSTTPKAIGAGELALRLLASRGTRAYFIYLVGPGAAVVASAETELELRALDNRLTIGLLAPPSAEQLLRGWSSRKEDVLLVGAEPYVADDWRLLDRRRSDLAREGATVLMTGPSSFEALMRVAPNLASWLGGNVFARETEDSSDAEWREQRLVALRAWSGKGDREVIAAATAGALPRDPEYAEWLVLLGRENLLDAE